jgi:hypothetical protein
METIARLTKNTISFFSLEAQLCLRTVDKELGEVDDQDDFQETNRNRTHPVSSAVR